MPKAWLTTIIAAVCAVGFATTAIADPASMAMSGRNTTGPATSSSWSIWPWSKTAATPASAVPGAPTTLPVQPAPQAPPAYAASQPGATWPSAEVSPWRHPIQYFKSSMPEMPVGPSFKAASQPVMPPAQAKSDPLSLSVPTGPPTPEFFVFAAQMCERQGDIPQARQNLQRALALWPGNADVLRAAARMEDRQGGLPLAESLYQQAVAANPQNAAALNDLGLCLARQGKLEPSLGVIEQAVQLQPDKALYRNNAATVLIEMRQDQRALAHLSAVHNQADANFNLGQLLIERGRAADAAPYFQAALQQNPGMQKAQDALAKLQPQVAVATPAVPQQAVPAGPQTAPQQQNWTTGPQLSYPATARTPAVGASSYAPPRYLPPVASQPGVMRR